MRNGIRIGTWVAVGDDCPIEYSVNGDHEVEMLMGGRYEGFEVMYTPAALERFLALGAEALDRARQVAAGG